MNRLQRIYRVSHLSLRGRVSGVFEICVSAFAVPLNSDELYTNNPIRIKVAVVP